ncbi:MAG: sensor histidine kinase [Lachnospirales bacterium]
MVFFLVEILATYFEGLICMLASKDLFSKAKDNNIIKILILPCIYTIIITLCNQIAVVSQYNLLISVCVLSVLVLLLWGNRVIDSVMMGISYMEFILIIDMFFISLISVITNDSQYVNKIIEYSNIERVVYIIFMKIVLFTSYLLLHKRLQKVDYKIIEKPAYIISVVIGFIMVIKMMDIIIANDANYLKIGIATLFVAIVIILVLVMNLTASLIKKQAEIDGQMCINMKNEILEKNLKNINSLFKENSKSFHEFKHHIDVLNMLLEEEKYDKMGEYLSEINVVSKYENEYKTGNKIIDMVLNIEYDRMKDMGIKFNTDIDISENLNVSDTDICSLLSNLLDNAIEANENNVDKNINLHIKTKGNMLILSVSNPCSTDPCIDNLTSSKEGNHGWGVEIIRDIARKYDGELIMEWENKIFTSRVLLIENRRVY